MTTKDDLKRIMREQQEGLCAITGLPLPEDTKLFDLDRYPIPGSNGGKYEPGNVRALLPQAHRDVHDNMPDDQLTELRMTMREYRTWVAIRNKLANHFLAYKRQMGELSGATQGGFDMMLKQAETHLKYFKKL